MRAYFKVIDSILGNAVGLMGVLVRRQHGVGSQNRWLAYLCWFFAVIACQPAFAGTTGIWTSAASPSATANGIAVTAIGSASLTPATGALYATPYWTNPYGASVAGGTSLNYVVSPGGTSMTVTFTFSKAVSNPVLHIQRLGGQAGTINSSSWQLSGSNLGTTPTLSRLSGNFQFQLNGANTTFFRPAGGTFVSAACTSAAGSTSDDGGTACGSVRVNGAGITSLTFTVSMIGGPGTGDGLDLAWSIPNEAIVVKKQSLGATGTFNFSGTNGVLASSLNTASTNPAASVASTITNLTQPVTLTETPTTGFTLSGASCVDQTAAAIASSLSGSTLTIASSAYSDNGTITCSFINQAVPILSVAKSAPSPALAFGVNSIYSLTIANTGAAPATTAQVKDQLPTGLSFVSATGPNWSCANLSGLITCNFSGGSIAAGGGTSLISVVATPIATAGNTNVTNYAAIDPSGGASAPVPGVGCAPAAACASNTSRVQPYINPAPEVGTSVSGTAATPIANVVGNDTINGVAATLGAVGNATVAQSGTWPTGIVLNTTTGAISVDTTVQPGTYSVSYQLCEKGSPVTCKAALDTITVSANMAPTSDTGSVVSGVASIPVANIVANDNVNGAPATLGPSGNAVITPSGTWPAALSLNPLTGAVSTTGALLPGSYTVSYQLCDKSVPANCTTSTILVTVAANIAPVADMGTATAGIASTPIANVGANDGVNGAPAVLSGPSTNATVAIVGSWPVGIALNAATGAITTTATVPPGTYNVPYRLCDTNVPVNCANSSATFTVSATILPSPDSGSGMSGTASTVITNIVSNDRVNGSAATLAGASFNATVSQSGVWPGGITLNPLTGNVAIAASVQPGVYTLAYQLCDRNSPVNCATSTNTITVAAAIAPNADVGTATSGTRSTPIANVVANDTLNGFPATLGATGNATVATIGSWPAGLSLDPLTGAVSSSANVQPGTYVLGYDLCDKNTPVNCQSQTVTITVAARISPVNDAGSAASGTASTPVANVAANDIVNGFAATLDSGGNAIVAQSGIWPLGITLNPETGAINTTPDVQPGTYVVAYQLCDKNVPVNCVTANATVTVVGTIIPAIDDGNAISGTPATAIANIAANDMVNGDPATLGLSGNATLSQSGVWPVGITLDPLTGAVSTNANVQPGNYALTYQLCDKSVPVFCALTTLAINVAPDIAPVIDEGTSTSGTATIAIANVATNDSVNGNPATLGSGGTATLSQLSTTNPGIALNIVTGGVNVAANVQPGSYAVTYRLCDRNSPVNCAITTANVTVGANIAPTTESGTAIAGTASTPMANVAANDMVNGVAATLGAAGNSTIAISGAWPSGVTLNPSTGGISTSSVAAPGSYTLAYQLCDKNTPANCTIISDTLTISGDIRPRLDTGSAIAGTTSTAIVNVAANDKVNGFLATLGSGGNATIAQSGVWPVGITLDLATGSISSDTSVVPGTYTLPYTLCDTSVPANCAVQNAIITVFAAIRPSPDIVAVSASGGTALPNVTANDVVNGMSVMLGNGGNATIGEVGIWPTGINLDPATGAVTVLAGTPPGTYTVNYQLCDLNLPVNCASTIVTIRVSAAIAPVGDIGSSVSGTTSVVIGSVAAGDTVNGIAATLGASGNATTAQSGIWPTGIDLNPATGAITTQATVQPGTYSVAYELCDINTPINCATALETITVTANIAPVDDVRTMVAGTLTNAISNVAANDLVNGTPASLGSGGNATLEVSGIWPSGIALDPATGGVTVGARVQPGIYNLDYELCDRNTPTNCHLAKVTISVTATILPSPDNGTAIAGTASIPVANIAANDSVNGTPAIVAGSSSTASVALVGSWPAGFTFASTTGAISISNTVVPGTYALPYELCDRNAPPNCATSTATIVVSPEIVPTLQSGSALSGVPTVAITNIGANDRVNGTPAIIGGPTPNATVVPSGTWPAGVTLDPVSGNLSTSAAVQPGVYVLPYQLCDVNTPANCAIQNVTLTVAGVIAPAADTGASISGTASMPVPNVTFNDIVNGMPVTLGTVGNANVTPSGIWPSGISLDPFTGAISTNSNLQPGTYNLQYELCDRSTPVNCATQSVAIVVAGNIAPLPDNGTAISGIPSTPIINIAINDTVNGSPATLGVSANAILEPSGIWPVGIALNPVTGAVSTSASVQPGTYELSYQLCDRSTPANCQNQLVTIEVGADIAPMADAGTGVSGTPSTLIGNVVANDKVNGAASVLGTSGNATIAPSGTWPTGITLDPATGGIATTALIAPGTYIVRYQLCDRNVPTNCQTQSATLVISGNIAPIADSGSAMAGTASTPIANLTANDRVNGSPVTLGTSGNARVTQSGNWPAGLSLDPSTGGVSTSAALPPGTYAVSYQLCDTSVPANCALQSVSIVVAANIDPIADAGRAVSGTASTPITNIAANDKVNGAVVTLGAGGNALITQMGVWPAGIALDPATGAVSTNAMVQPGTYALTYQLCDTNVPANCQTQNVTVTLTGNILLSSDAGVGQSGVPSTPLANVTVNDSVNGAPAILGINGNAVIAPSGTWPQGLTLDPMTGEVKTTADVVPGIYNVTYQLCDKSTPANCATQTITITIGATITPIADIGVGQSGIASTSIANITANDIVNGRGVQLGTGGNATVAQTGLWPVSVALDPSTGAVLLSVTAQPGSQVVTYQLCDKNTPVNCEAQTITITVSANLLPSGDTGTAISGTPSTPIANIAGNDSVNGAPAALGVGGNATVAVSGTWPLGLGLDPATGAVSSSAAVQPGTYTVTYQLCDRSTPVNCQAQTLTITVTGNIAPVADTGTANSGQPSTAITNVTANDTVNGMPVLLGVGGNAHLTQTGVWPAGLNLDANSGAVATTSALPAGTYVVRYQLCDRSTPANCQNQSVTIIVAESKGSITGSVYTDTNVDRQRQGNEPPRANWIVELVSNGRVVATTTTDASGNYRLDNVPQGSAYEIRFINPENSVVFGRINNVVVTAGAAIIDQNQPIDPAGVVFDSVTRLPVAGAIVTIVDTQGIALPANCFMDASQRTQTTGRSGEYRFDLVPGAAVQCPRGETVYRIVVASPAGYSADSTVLLPLQGPFDPTGLTAPVRISPLPTPALTGEVPYYLSFRLAAGDPDIVFNHIALDPFLTRTPLVVIKTSSLRSASVGDLVPYEITVRNTEAVRRAGVTIVDVLPAGMKFVSGSASVDGNPNVPIINDRNISWLNQTIPANASIRYRLVLIVGAGVSGGDKVNTGLAINPATGTTISNRGTAVISIVPSAVFDCSDLIGKVFEDRNQNGYQDEGEQGVAGVRLATVNGQLVTTDAFGRYHITCAGIPDARIGSNFVLKVDTRTLPLGWGVTTDNPRSIRLTRGKFGELNFGVAPIQPTQSDAPRKAEGE